MPSFDAVLEPDMVAIKNSVANAEKEIGTRFDFKGTAAKVELKEKDKQLELVGDLTLDVTPRRLETVHRQNGVFGFAADRHEDLDAAQIGGRVGPQDRPDELALLPGRGGHFTLLVVLFVSRIL